MSLKKTIFACIMALASLSASAQSLLPYQNHRLSPEQRAEDLIGRLTLEEKARLMLNNSKPIERLGIPSFQWWNEALHGVGRNGFTTVFPITMGMAASWDDILLQQCFEAVSDEARIKNQQAKRSGVVSQYQGLSFWTPNINIFRDPRWGRGQETYGEDPYLTTRMGMAVVRGLQGPDDAHYRKLLACAKHYAVHSGPEWNRHTFDIQQLPERDLWETYMPAFKTLVQDGHVEEVMCAYQRIDGSPCCGNTRYLQQILRDEWGFNGIVVSDCGAIRDFYQEGCHEVVKTASEAAGMAVLAGTDLNCGSVYNHIPKAVKDGTTDMETIDRAVKRLLVARFRLGDMDPDDIVPWTKIPEDRLCSKQHNNLAYRMAQESMVLLQNNNSILPLKKDGIKVAVMGPNAADSVMQWGNYSGYPKHTVTILQGIEKKLKGRGTVRYIGGCGHTSNIARVSHFTEMVAPDGQQGMEATFWNNTKMEGDAANKVVFKAPVHLNNGGNTVFAPGVELENFTASLRGTLCPKEAGEIILSVEADDGYRMTVNGKIVADRLRSAHGVQKKEHRLNVKPGEKYDIQIDYIQFSGMAHLQFDAYHTEQLSEESILSQVGDADAVIFVGGISPRLEGEEMKVDAKGFKGGDRTDIQLPDCQRSIIGRLSAAGKRIVYINCSGSAVALVPETERCEAILQAWYPGERGGDAIADVIFGDYNPSGKLPVTFYRSADDLPDFLDYTMKNRTYRYFNGSPLWAFGYGLSYTTFSFGKPRYKDGIVTVDVKNTGERDGDEVVQVYIRRTADTEGPKKTLKAFKRVTLNAGETKTVAIDMPRSSFEVWDAETSSMRPLPGRYEVMVGSSSRDEDLTKVNVKLR